MKKMRIPLYITIGIALIGFILGTFFDYQISKAIANPTSIFALLVSSIGPTIAFGAISFAGGGLISIAIHQEWKKWIRFLFIVIGIGTIALATIIAGKEYFGKNGFNNPTYSFIGYLIAGLVSIGGEIGGYFAFKDCQNKNAWIAIFVVYILMALVMLLASNITKAIVNRPRFRVVMTGNVHYYEWFERCVDYQYYMDKFGYAREEFRSFPSGHTAEASMFMMTFAILPLAHLKLEKIQIPLFIAGVCFTLLIALARVLAAAHYLSDVAMGMLLIALLTLIANEVCVHIKKLHPENA